MEQCTRGGWRDHGAKQPGVERHLRRLRETRERQATERDGDELGVRSALDDEALERERAEVEHGQVKRHEERDAADEVHDNLAEGVADGFFGARVGDEQERAGRRDLPPCEHPRHIVREHDDEHRREEQEHEREERRTAVLALQFAQTVSFAVLVDVLLEVHHVAKRINADPAADDADDQRHDDRQRIDVEARHDMRVMGEAELEDHVACDLYRCQGDDEVVLVFHAEPDDHTGERNAHRATDVVDDLRRELEPVPRRPQVLHGQRNRPGSYGKCRYGDDNVTRAIGPHEQQQAGNHQGKQYKKRYELHCKLPFSLIKRMFSL